MDDLIHRIQQRVDALPAGLKAHIHRVRDICQQLAERHGIPRDRADLAILAHDVARAMPPKDLIRRAAQFGLPIGPVESQVPILLHGPVGAELLRREEGLDDPAIYRAIRWHSTAHPSLDALGKAVFLADKLDPQKITRYPYLPQLHPLALEDLDRALLEFLTRELIALASQGQPVHPAMVKARNALLAPAVTSSRSWSCAV